MSKDTNYRKKRERVLISPSKIRNMKEMGVGVMWESKNEVVAGLRNMGRTGRKNRLLAVDGDLRGFLVVQW